MRTMSLVLVMLALAACGKTRAPISLRVASRDQCILSPELPRLAFHVLIPIQHTGDTERAHSRQLYSFDCTLETIQCEGVRLDVDKIEQGEPVGMFDLALAKGGQIVSTTGSVFTVTWGLFRTFVVDVGRGLVT